MHASYGAHAELVDGIDVLDHASEYGDAVVIHGATTYLQFLHRPHQQNERDELYALWGKSIYLELRKLHISRAAESIIMLSASLLIAGLACGSGLWAAGEWWRASRIPVLPVWEVEPGEATSSMQGWIAAIMAASDKSSRQNARAAIWTGISIALSGLATFCGLGFS